MHEPAVQRTPAFRAPSSCLGAPRCRPAREPLWRRQHFGPLQGFFIFDSEPRFGGESAADLINHVDPAGFRNGTPYGSDEQPVPS